MALKTCKSVAKRFKFTKKGKIRYSRSSRSHLLFKKESDKKRQLRKPRFLKRQKDKRKIRRLLPYG